MAALRENGGLSFLKRGPARAAREKVLGWKPEIIVIARGKCADDGTTAIIGEALSWI